MALLDHGRTPVNTGYLKTGPVEGCGRHSGSNADVYETFPGLNIFKPQTKQDIMVMAIQGEYPLVILSGMFFMNLDTVCFLLFI